MKGGKKMLDKIDCKNMFKDNDSHLSCVYTGKNCNFEKGENNGMKCGSYKVIKEGKSIDSINVTEKYLVTYDYKIANGCLISLRTETKIFTLTELESLTRENNYYNNYIKIIFCQKL